MVLCVCVCWVLSQVQGRVLDPLQALRVLGPSAPIDYGPRNDISIKHCIGFTALVDVLCGECKRELYVCMYVCTYTYIYICRHVYITV